MLTGVYLALLLTIMVPIVWPEHVQRQMKWYMRLYFGELAVICVLWLYFIWSDR
jgi:hypothetical protein